MNWRTRSELIQWSFARKTCATRSITGNWIVARARSVGKDEIQRPVEMQGHSNAVWAAPWEPGEEVATTNAKLMSASHPMAQWSWRSVHRTWAPARVLTRALLSRKSWDCKSQTLSSRLVIQDWDLRT